MLRVLFDSFSMRALCSLASLFSSGETDLVSGPSATGWRRRLRAPSLANKIERGKIGPSLYRSLARIALGNNLLRSAVR